MSLIPVFLLALMQNSAAFFDDVLPGDLYFEDKDGDGFGYGDAREVFFFDPPPGWVPNVDDCDDEDGSVNPDADEVCDGIDNDCDGLIDAADPEVDSCPCGVVEGDVFDVKAWYPDGDGDGYGAGIVLFACAQPSGYVDNGDDCDDSWADINPDADEFCDGIDNDCDGLIDDDDPDLVEPCTDVLPGDFYFEDKDGDGYGQGVGLFSEGPFPGWVLNSDDCDDEDGSVNPGADEVCDGIDNDCDGLIDDDDPDAVESCADDACDWLHDPDACADPYTLGNAVPFTSRTTLTPGNALAVRVEATEEVWIESVSLGTYRSYSGTTRLVLYDDMDGLPNAWVGELATLDGLEPGVNTAEVHFSVPAGTYWILFDAYDRVPLNIRYNHLDGSGQKVLVPYIKKAFEDPYPLVIESPYTYRGQEFNVYLTVR
jgi:hypothetical protein